MSSKMLLPPHIAEKLRCANCRQYLSTHPVKVYPDHHVRCLRCSRGKEKGVPSLLYQTVVEHLQFPCVNAQNGCDEPLSSFQTLNHEATCMVEEHKSKGYTCAICAHERHSSMDIVNHIKHTHKNTLLRVPAFSFPTDEGSFRLYKVHFTGKYLVTLFMDWDDASQNFAVFAVCPAQTRRRHITCSMTLYDVYDNAMAELPTLKCGKMSPLRSRDFTRVRIPPYSYARGVTVVKFEVKDTPVLILPDPNDHLSFRGPRAVIRWEPRDVSRLDNTKELMSPAYYVNGAPWRIVLKKRVRVKPNQLGVYLRCDQHFTDEYPKLKFSVLYHCTIESSDPQKTITDRSKSRDEYKKGAPLFGSMSFMDWSKFMDPDNGFIQNGGIKFELDIDVRIK